jgi:Mg/Co/Ni transporter MgtE
MNIIATNMLNFIKDVLSILYWTVLGGCLVGGIFSILLFIQFILFSISPLLGLIFSITLVSIILAILLRL